jgi:hypothetical protein
MDTLKLPFGLSEAVPAGADIAWGARFIINMDGHVDLPPDRQGFAGDGDRGNLIDKMQEACPLNDLMSLISELILEGSINTRVTESHLLVNTGVICIVGDTKASAGYFYVAAFLGASLNDGSLVSP